VDRRLELSALELAARRSEARSSLGSGLLLLREELPAVGWLLHAACCMETGAHCLAY
jgi:hypothetical protein